MYGYVIFLLFAAVPLPRYGGIFIGLACKPSFAPRKGRPTNRMQPKAPTIYFNSRPYVRGD